MSSQSPRSITPHPSSRPAHPAGRARRAGATLLAAVITWQPILSPQVAYAAIAPEFELFDEPFLAGERIPPYVMLTITKDQQLFKKAYDDYSDLDSDGNLDTTYRHAIDYYGYFDSYKCYSYSASNRRFEPANFSNDKYCANGGAVANASGSAGRQGSLWSGNFLNWATMTRMDVLRKVLFGGLRSPNRTSGDGNGISDGDTATGSVLERAYLPFDAHSFTKYYEGTDLNKLTPYVWGQTTVTGGTSIARPSGGAAANNTVNADQRWIRIGDFAGFNVGEAVEVSKGGASIRGRISARGGAVPNQWIEVTTRDGSSSFLDTHVVGAATDALDSALKVVNLSTRGVTVCNTTNGETGSGDQSKSEKNTYLPRMKVAQGNYALWNANERWQCTWSGERNPTNGNDFRVSGLPAYSNSPAVGGDNIDQYVRVQACVDGKVRQTPSEGPSNERCRQYPNGKFKPAGLLQSFGENDRIRFGLVTGSYLRNLSGGVLRKNISKITDEINVNTGQFLTLASSGVGNSVAPGNSAVNFSGGSIIRNLSLLRIVGYNYDQGHYIRTPEDCSYQRELDTNGECMSWGNPMSEVYYEGLRYLAGQTSATSAFTTDDSTILPGMTRATWPTNSTALLSRKNYCAPLNMLVINGAVSTSEKDNQLDTAPSFMAGSPGTPKALTDKVGIDWGLSGDYFFGQSSSLDTRSCTGKTLTSLGDIAGICPEGPTLMGTYLMSGLAYHAHTNRIRTDISITADELARQKRKPLQVDTYGVQLSSGVPRIPVMFAGETTPRAVIQPAYRLLVGGKRMGGALVDLRVVSQSATADESRGTIFASWEDSEAGGDYDMDVWGMIKYRMNRATNTIQITTDAVYQATANPQGFGYVIDGTTQDGVHYHSGVLGFTNDDTSVGLNVVGPTGKLSLGRCVDCQANDGPSTATFTLSATPPAQSFEDPLYYTSLFGGFEDKDGDGKPTKTLPEEFDKLNNKTGASGPDGVPDNFFLVNNPLGLESGLERVFQRLELQSSLAAVQSNTSQLSTNTKVFQATFDSADWSGNLVATKIEEDGKPGPVLWQARNRNLKSTTVDHNSRAIVTMHATNRQPVPFRWSSLSTHQQALLNADGFGTDRLLYLRGDISNEGNGAGGFRQRGTTVLGDIVDSSPVYVGAPSAGVGGASYLSFALANRTRRPLVYVGANDGMLHAFDAETGDEVWAYVPTPMYKNLTAFSAPGYAHRYYVNGQLTVADAQVGGTWRTYLGGGLGKGGQGVYLLDVTDPSKMAESTAASVVKWEFTDRDDPELGYVYSEPLIRLMPNGRWAMVFSGGFNATEADFNDPSNPARSTAGTTGKSTVFILFLEGPSGTNGTWVEGTDYVKLQTSNNGGGLGGVVLYDVEGDGISDYIYGGDQEGKLWRFHLNGNAASTWSAAGNRIVLFEAKAADGRTQPITASPVLMPGPQLRGAFVMFGTGRLLERDDLSPPTTAPTTFVQNSMYGLWDKPATTTSPALGTTTITRAQLMKQVYLASEGNTAYGDSEASKAAQFSMLSKYIPNYSDATRTNLISGTDPMATGPTGSTQPQRGWLVDVLDKEIGERTIYTPRMSGEYVIFNNLMPSGDACSGGGDSAMYALDFLTGGRSDYGGLDRNDDLQIRAQNYTNAAGETFKSDRSSFGGPTDKKYFASRREDRGAAGGGTAGAIMRPPTPTQICTGVLAYRGSLKDTGVFGTALPGACPARVQWRELQN